MFDTPQKDFPNKISSLRQQIQSKLLASNKKLDTKENIFKKYQSHNKNNSQNKIICQDYNKRNFNSVKTELLTNKQNHNSITQQKLIQPIITENNILEFQSLENRNFYGFDEWIQFNKKFFNHVQEQTVRNLWKIMRTINYGDIWIPSGLIFQVSKVLTYNQSIVRGSLKQVFNKFLKFNHASDQVNNFRQLKNYPTFQEIEKSYLKLNKKQFQSLIKKNKLPSSQKTLSFSNDVFQRVYNESKTRNQKKNLSIYKSLVEKQRDQQFIFKPKINQYCPEKLFIDQTLKPSRICHQKKKWETIRADQNYSNAFHNFKNQSYQRSKYQNTSVQQIPGVAQYIERQKFSDSKKRKIQRYKQNPTLVFKHD